MKKIELLVLLVITLLSSSIVTAKMYKGFDAEGNVVYSDTPFEDAEKYTPPPISVVDTPQVTAKKSAAKDAEDKKQADFKYMDFDVASPTANQVIWNEPDLSVSLNLRPALNVAEGHNIWLLVDNKAKVKNSQSTSFNIGRLDRGSHEVQALIKDSDGKTVVRTRSTMFFIQQGSR